MAGTRPEVELPGIPEELFSYRTAALASYAVYAVRMRARILPRRGAVLDVPMSQRFERGPLAKA